MRRYDLERVGSINFEAFEHALRPFLSLSGQDMRALFQDCDVRSSGKLDIEMFCSLVDYWRKNANILLDQRSGSSSSDQGRNEAYSLEWSSEFNDALEVVCKRRRDAFMQACLQLSGGGDTTQPLLLKEFLMAVRFAGVPTTAGLVKEFERYAAVCGARPSSGRVDPLAFLRAAETALAQTTAALHSRAAPAPSQVPSASPIGESSSSASTSAGGEAQAALVGVGAGFWRRAGQYLQTHAGDHLGDPSMQLITLDNCAEAFARAGLKLSRHDALAMWRAVHAEVSKTPDSEPGHIAIPFRDLERTFRNKLSPSPAAAPMESASLVTSKAPVLMRPQRHGPHGVEPAATCPWAVDVNPNDDDDHNYNESSRARTTALHAARPVAPFIVPPPSKPAAGARIASRSLHASLSAVPAVRSAPYALGSSFGAEAELQPTQPQAHMLPLPSDSPRREYKSATSHSHNHYSSHDSARYSDSDFFSVNRHHFNDAPREAPAPPPVRAPPPKTTAPLPAISWPVPELDAPAGLQTLLRRTRMVPSETLDAILSESGSPHGGSSDDGGLGRGDVARVLARCGIVVRDAEIEALLFFAEKTFGFGALSMPAVRYLLGLPVSSAGWARLEQDRNFNLGLLQSDQSKDNNHDEYNRAVSPFVYALYD